MFIFRIVKKIYQNTFNFFIIIYIFWKVFLFISFWLVRAWICLSHMSLKFWCDRWFDFRFMVFVLFGILGFREFCLWFLPFILIELIFTHFSNRSTVSNLWYVEELTKNLVCYIFRSYSKLVQVENYARFNFKVHMNFILNYSIMQFLWQKAFFFFN